MDEEQLHEAGQAWGHRTYGPMMNRKVVFPHHQPKPGTKDYEHFHRSTERLLKILHAPERKLFILGHLEKAAKAKRDSRDLGDLGDADDVVLEGKPNHKPIVC